MRKRTDKLQIYTVVEVWRGIAQGAKNFARMSDAQNYVRRVRRRHNPLEDEVTLFRNKLCLRN